MKRRNTLANIGIIRIGVWEDDSFIGCVLFSRGSNKRIGSPYGLDQTECVELTRIALREHKHFVSEIMMQAIKKLKEFCPDLKLIVSYADPEQGHIGAIYQATNWIFVGHLAPNQKYLVNGKSIHPRTLNAAAKLKNISRTEYFLKLYKNGIVTKDKGKFKYLMPLDKKIRKLLLPLAKPYPKLCDLEKLNEQLGNTANA